MTAIFLIKYMVRVCKVPPELQIILRLHQGIIFSLDDLFCWMDDKSSQSLQKLHFVGLELLFSMFEKGTTSIHGKSHEIL